MSGTQKVNKLSRKSKKKPSQSQKLDDSLVDFSSADPSEKRTQKVEKKSDIFSSTQTKSIKSICEQPERAFSNNASELNPLDRGIYSSESNPPDNVNVASSANADLKPVENVDAVSTVGPAEDCLPPVRLADCPMCGKQFKPGLVLQRNAHLKSCGNKLGMKADKLVELRRLEERQAEERAALGFPIVPKSQAVDKPPKKVQRKSKPAKDEGADADLELALALSISAHNGETPLEHEVVGSIGTQFGVRCEGVNSEAQLRVNSGTEVGSKPTEVPKSSQTRRASMWLPQVTVPQKKRGKKKLVGKTVLQTRSEAERERLVGEKVAALLYPEAEYNPQLDRIIRSTLPERKCNERLVKLEDPDNLFWSLASLPKTAKSDQFLADKLENYIDIKQFGDCREKICDRTTETSKVDVTVEKSDCNERILEEIKKSVQPSLKNLSDQWVSLFKSKKKTDLKILCRDEEVVLCHRLVLEVRCPTILNDTVKEIADEVKEEIVIWSSFDYKIVMVFVEFLYGGILDLSVIETVEELIQLKQIAEFNKVKEIIDILMEVKIEEADINDVTGGFCEENVDKEIPSSTQNLDALLDCLDNFEKDEVEKVEEKDMLSVEEEEEEDWDEVCEFMTQKVKQSVDRSQLVVPEEDFDLKLSDNDTIFDEEQNDVIKSSPVQSESKPSSLLEKSTSTESVKVATTAISRASSPDLFGSDDDDDDIIETQWNLSQNTSNHISTPVSHQSERNSSKRKLQLLDDCGDQDLKKRRTLSPLPPTSPLNLLSSSPSRPISWIPPMSPERLDFSDNSNELPTPTKYRISPKSSPTKSLIKDSSRFSMNPNDDKEVYSDNDEVDDVVDLTQTTPTPPNIPPCDVDKMVESAPSSIVNSPISIKSSPVNFIVNSQSNSPKSHVSSPKSSSSPLKSLSSTPKSSLLKSKPSSSPSISSPLKSKLSTVNLINKLVGELGDPNVDDKHTETCLKMLCDLEVTVPMMLETGVGKLVRQLRDREGRIGRLAGRLVARWKKLVFAYDGPEVPKNRNTDLGLNSQKPSGSPAKAASNEEEVIGDDVLACNDNKEHDKEVNSDIEQNGDIWGNEANNICDNADSNTDKDISYENDELARLQMEDSAFWRPESEPIPITPQAHTTPHRTVQSIKKSAKQLLTPQNRPKSATPLRIQSLKNCAAKAATPKSSVNSGNAFMTPENVRNRQLPDATPIQDYDMMLTPELRQELHRFGLKAVPRRKAVQLLQFIYDKTHPFVDKENSSPYVEAKNLKRNSPKPNSISKSKMKTSAKKVRIAHKPSTSKSSLNVEIDKSADCSNKSTNVSAKCSSKASENRKDEEPEEEDLNLSQGSTCSNESNGCDVPEESMMVMDDEDEDDITPSQILTEGNLQTQLRSLIHSRPDLHHSILIFEPIWLKEFFLLVKQAGIKCKLPQVMDFLDQECITFRTESNRNNRQKKKASPKKKSKTSPEKPKSPKKKGGRKKKDPIN